MLSGSVLMTGNAVVDVGLPRDYNPFTDSWSQLQAYEWAKIVILPPRPWQTAMLWCFGATNSNVSIRCGCAFHPPTWRDADDNRPGPAALSAYFRPPTRYVCRRTTELTHLDEGLVDRPIE